VYVVSEQHRVRNIASIGRAGLALPEGRLPETEGREELVGNSTLLNGAAISADMASSISTAFIGFAPARAGASRLVANWSSESPAVSF
jgi:hypothetical protein